MLMSHLIHRERVKCPTLAKAQLANEASDAIWSARRKMESDRHVLEQIWTLAQEAEQQFNAALANYERVKGAELVRHDLACCDTTQTGEK
jgi:hypothetical protein